ncbi:MAG: flavodoxin [bacterium]|nr:flavodoxin [bacterium]
MKIAEKKILVVYFSHSGNTREIANRIHEHAGGDVFEVVPVDQYPADYDAVVAQAKRELNSGYKPALKTKVKDFGRYDVVFIGYPVWWSTVPPPVVTFLSESDLSGKTIVPFCTHEGSSFGHSVTDISRLCPRSTVFDGLAVRGSDVKKAQNKVSAWLQGLKFTQPERSH